MRREVAVFICWLVTTTRGQAAAVIWHPSPLPVARASAEADPAAAAVASQTAAYRPWLPQWRGSHHGDASGRHGGAGNTLRTVRQVYFDPQPVNRAPAVPQIPQAPQAPQHPDSVAKYEFEYEVKHPPSGVDFGHHERRDGPVTTGRYRVTLPDGRLQMVNYRADHDGYVANVQYVAQFSGTQQPQQQQQQQQHQQQQQQQQKQQQQQPIVAYGSEPEPAFVVPAWRRSKPEPIVRSRGLSGHTP